MNSPFRVFADSNVTLSASLGGTSDFDVFWHLGGVDIPTCQYSIAEVTRNLKRPEDRARLWHLLYRSHLVPDDETVVLPAEVTIRPKDLPILRAAIAATADVLITGDRKHFGAYWGMVILGLRIESPKMFKRRYPQYFKEIL